MVSADTLISVVWRLAVLLSLLLSLAAVRRLDRLDGRWVETLRSRFILGVPWGSIVSLSGVLAVYLFVQGGLWHWEEPVTAAFTASSYFYPIGLLFASFAHADPAHLTGNLTSALVLAPLAEYVWSHYPPEHGSRSSSSWRTRPWIRAVVVFPLGVLVAGLVGALFSWGPVIGFSSVVSAFAGFALVRYPLVTVVAFAAGSGVGTIADALSEPVVVERAIAEFTRPWWYGVAVQGHALGLFTGICAGAVLLRYRDDRPDALRVWIGTLLAGLSLSLWAVWWVRGVDSFVLYRALGVILVLALATLVTATLVASDRPLWRDVTRQRAAVALLLVPLVTMCLVAVPLNLNDVDAEPRDRSMSAGDYTVFYDEGVQDGMVSVVDVSILGETTDVTTSGVIVVNEDRQIWRTEVSAGRLELHGDREIHVGGIGWRETVRAERSGWTPIGNDTVYRVWLEHDGERQHVFDSGPATAEPVIDGREITVVSEGGEFYLNVDTDDGTDRTTLPSPGDPVAAGGIEFVLADEHLIAIRGETAVPIATEETYNDEPE